MVVYNHELNYTHGSQIKTGILLVNTGSPSGSTPREVRQYLAEFLWDPRMVEKPRWLWWLILHGIILRIRPAKSARAYQKVWTEHGSPLTHYVKQQAALLHDAMQSSVSEPILVEFGMRYGKPSIEEALETLRVENVRRILIFPLFPQYSAPTTASTFDAVANVLKKWRWLPELRMVHHYHDNIAYIRAITDSISQTWLHHEKPDKLLFSFHGLPKQMRDNGDPYYCMCQKTAWLVAKQLGLNDAQWMITFQSRMGVEEWLQPYTSDTLKEWGEQKMASVHVVCPGFSSDCLETLEEIAMQNKSIFLKAGGKNFLYIPALNTNQDHIAVLANVAKEHLSNWLDPSTGVDESEQRRQRQRALDLGATQ